MRPAASGRFSMTTMTKDQAVREQMQDLAQEALHEMNTQGGTFTLDQALSLAASLGDKGCDRRVCVHSGEAATNCCRCCPNVRRKAPRSGPARGENQLSFAATGSTFAKEPAASFSANILMAVRKVLRFLRFLFLRSILWRCAFSADA
jgi:hypothetical protein